MGEALDHKAAIGWAFSIPDDIRISLQNLDGLRQIHDPLPLLLGQIGETAQLAQQRV